MNGDYAFILNFHTALIFDDILSNILSILLRNTVDLKCILPKKKLLVAISGQMCLPCEMFCFVQFRLQIFDPFFEKKCLWFYFERLQKLLYRIRRFINYFNEFTLTSKIKLSLYFED